MAQQLGFSLVDQTKMITAASELARVARPGATVDPDGLVAWAGAQMANFKVPRHVELVQRLPLNPSGKVLKFELRDRARATVAG